jgi:hypothetical protein
MMQADLTQTTARKSSDGTIDPTLISIIARHAASVNETANIIADAQNNSWHIETTEDAARYVGAEVVTDDWESLTEIQGESSVLQSGDESDRSLH